MGIDEVGIDKVGIDEVGRYHLVIFWSLAMNIITILAGIQVSYTSVTAQPQ